MEEKNKHTALLVMDMQMQILSRLENKAPLITAVASAIAGARAASVPVIYVGLSFRNGFPEISSNNKSLNAFKQTLQGSNTMEVPLFAEEIAPLEGDIITIKKRISAFTGSDLEVILRSMQITHLVLTGISTSGIVLSTVREAADKDYELTVLSDGCADADAEVHNVLLNKVFPRQAHVITVGEWVAG